MLGLRLKGLLPTCAAIAAFPFAAVANPIITNVAETGGDNEAVDTVPAKWTGVTFSNGVSTEFPNPFLVPLFDEDVPAYVDRIHQWNGATVDLPLPNYLKGGEYIMIGNDNRDNANLKLDITVSEDVIVYILVDNRLTDGVAGDPPEGGLPLDQWTGMSWMATNGFAAVTTGWNRTADPSLPDEVGVDEGGNGTGPGGDIQNYSSVYSANKSAGTFSIYQPDNGGRNMYGVVVKRQPGSLNAPPEIILNAPTNNNLFFTAANGLSFSAKTVSPNAIAPANIKLNLNGADVTGLTVGGTSDNRTVTYNGLASDTAYRATIIATDQAGRSTTNQFSFDTFNPATAIMIEAEDYNFGGGQTPATIGVNSFTDQVGTVGVDYNEQNITIAATTYRTGEYVGLGTSGDVAREAITTAGGTDFVVNGLEAGDWLNYTRNIPAGTYKIFLRANATTPQRVELSKVSDGTATTQTTTPLGVFNVAAGPYGYAQLVDAAGNPVNIPLSGNTTLRLTALNAFADLQMNYLLLAPTTSPAAPAYIANVSPVGANASGDAIVRAVVVNGTTTATAATIAFDGTDVSSQATVTPNATGFVGTFDPAGTLAPGSPHTVSVVLTDSAGTKTTNNWTFTVGSGVALPDNINTAPGTGLTPGFNVKIHKIDNAITGLANTAARAERQVAGQLADNAGVVYDNQAAGPNGDGLSTNLVLNFQQLGQVAGYVGGDEPYPYIDPAAGDPNNIALEATAYLELQPGMYRFGVRSDDGFRVTVGPTFGTASQVVGVYEGGRGDPIPGGVTEFNVFVTEAGLYPFKLLHYEGTGGASLEFYTVDPVTLKRTLVNAPDSPVKAYTARSVQLFVPTVSITAPAANGNFPLNTSTNVEIKVDAAVQGGTITKVEFFEGTNKLGEATSAPFTFTAPNVGIGKHTITAKATDNQGFSTTSAPITFTVGTPLVRVNFQAATATTPEGYLPDLGDIFGDRGNGFSYGWDDDNTQHARERNNANSPDKRYDTFNHMQKTTPLPVGQLWEIEIPNGTYRIIGASGDPTATDSVFDVRAEGQPFISGVPVTGNWFFDGTTTVNVADGRLTISNGPQAVNNKINWIDIYAVAGGQQPAPELTATMSGGNINVTWTGGGTLEFKTDLNAPTWTSTGNSSGTFSEPTSTAQMKFFRVAR